MKLWLVSNYKGEAYVVSAESELEAKLALIEQDTTVVDTPFRVDDLSDFYASEIDPNKLNNAVIARVQK